MRISTVKDSIAALAKTHHAELVCTSQVTDPVVITLGVVDTMDHHNRSVSICITVVRVSTMTDKGMNADIVSEETMIILEVDVNIDIKIETYRGAGLAAGRRTPGGHTALNSAVTLLTADPAVPVIVATGTTIEIDTIDRTDIGITAAGLILLR